MTTEELFADAALRQWKANVDRASKFFEALSEEELLGELAPGKNRLIYLWGHLTAVNDLLLPLLRLGERLHPELDEVFLTNPDRALPLNVDGAKLKEIWRNVNTVLDQGLAKISAAEWLERHNTVAPEDFTREPHRSRFTVLLSRMAHIANHMGQAELAKRKG